MKTDEEIILRGIPVSKGIGIGFPIYFSNSEENVPEVQILPREIDFEIEHENFRDFEKITDVLQLL